MDAMRRPWPGQQARTRGTARPAETYRAARRNAWRAACVAAIVLELPKPRWQPSPTLLRSPRGLSRRLRRRLTYEARHRMRVEPKPASHAHPQVHTKRSFFAAGRRLFKEIARRF